MCSTQNTSVAAREEYFRRKYGELLTLNEIAEVLRYPSTQALRKAYERGTLPLELRRFPNRRGYFATARAVAMVVDSLEQHQ